MSNTDFLFPKGTEGKELNEFIARGANLLGEAEVIKSDLKELGNDAKDKFEIPTGLFNKYVKARFDKMKILDQKEELEQIIEDLNLTKPQFED